jgi:hypothetical protein
MCSVSTLHDWDELTVPRRRVETCFRKKESQPCPKSSQAWDTHGNQLRQPTDTLMGHELILHEGERWRYRTSRKISRQSVKAHCKQDGIAASARPIQRVRGT